MKPFYEPELPLEPPEPNIIGECICCGGEIYEGSEYYTTDNDEMVHADNYCVNELWNDLSIDEKADILGLVKGEM